MASKSLLEKVKHYHKESFEKISKALEIDEDKDGDKEEAVLWYKKGIPMLEQGINVPVMGASPEDKEKIIRIQTKMIKNLELAKERCERLGKDEPTSKEAALKPQRPKDRPFMSATSKVHKPKTSNYVTPGRTAASVFRPSHHLPHRSNSAESPSKKKSSTGTANSTPKLASKNFKSIPSELAKRIMDTAVEEGSNDVKFSNVSGQESAKEALQEIVILPALRPDLFSGLRSPAKGLLLFGPPGNGKTLLAKAVASEAKSVFFNISAAVLTSKWVGEGEKMVKALFAVAREVQPSVIFIDEIDSLLRARTENENDASRRLQTEFFLQFDGVGSDPNDRILVMGATNRPHELDDAALRRFPKRIYVRLPDSKTRIEHFSMLLLKLDNSLTKSQIGKLALMCENYSFSDLTDLVKDASLGPIREIPREIFKTIDAKTMRKINLDDFTQSLKKIRPSVSLDLLRIYEDWNNKHGDVTSV